MKYLCSIAFITCMLTSYAASAFSEAPKESDPQVKEKLTQQLNLFKDKINDTLNGLLKRAENEAKKFKTLRASDFNNTWVNSAIEDFTREANQLLMTESFKKLNLTDRKTIREDIEKSELQMRTEIGTRLREIVAQQEAEKDKTRSILDQFATAKKDFDTALNAIIKRIQQTSSIADVEYSNGGLGNEINQLTINTREKITNLRKELEEDEEIWQAFKKLSDYLDEQSDRADTARRKRAAELRQSMSMTEEKKELKPEPTFESKTEKPPVDGRALDHLSSSLREIAGE